jgi:acyl-coenzyme A thioesterase PaaI-like protein
MTARPFGDMAMPAASKTLGWKLMSIDAKKGEIKLGFDGKAEFANPAGIIQGGMVAAMIDDAMASIVIAHFGMKKNALYH